MKENHQREEEDKVVKKKGKKDYIEKMAQESENEMMKFRKRK